MVPVSSNVAKAHFLLRAQPRRRLSPTAAFRIAPSRHSTMLLNSVLASCPILECLLLVHSFRFRRVCIGVSNHDACEIIIKETLDWRRSIHTHGCHCTVSDVK
jgi:hypothetical protein